MCFSKLGFWSFDSSCSVDSGLWIAEVKLRTTPPSHRSLFSLALWILGVIHWKTFVSSVTKVELLSYYSSYSHKRGPTLHKTSSFYWASVFQKLWPTSGCQPEQRTTILNITMISHEKELRSAEICWDLLRFAEICWDLLKFAEICWDLLRFAEIWCDEIWCDLVNQ